MNHPIINDPARQQALNWSAHLGTLAAENSIAPLATPTRLGEQPARIPRQRSATNSRHRGHSGGAAQLEAAAAPASVPQALSSGENTGVMAMERVAYQGAQRENTMSQSHQLHHPRVSRRTALQAGAVGLLGLGMN